MAAQHVDERRRFFADDDKHHEELAARQQPNMETYQRNIDRLPPSDAERGALNLQRIYRGHAVRQDFDERHRTATDLQRLARGPPFNPPSDPPL